MFCRFFFDIATCIICSIFFLLFPPTVLYGRRGYYLANMGSPNRLLWFTPYPQHKEKTIILWCVRTALKKGSKTAKSGDKIAFQFVEKKLHSDNIRICFSKMHMLVSSTIFLSKLTAYLREENKDIFFLGKSRHMHRKKGRRKKKPQCSSSSVIIVCTIHADNISLRSV